MASIADLKSDHKNARKRTDNSTRLIKQSLERYGAARSIVIDEDNRILAGNGTIDGAKALGLTKLKIIEAAGDEIIAVRRSGLSEDEKVGLAIADNRAAELSDWDAEMLKQLSEEHDLQPWFEPEDLEALLNDSEKLPAEGLTDPDEVPKVPEEPTTKPGDLWILGNHRLLCGDSTDVLAVERLMDGQKADMVFTDPPYGYSYESNYQTTHKMLANDDKILDFLPLALCALKDNSAIYLCASHQTAHKWRPLIDANFTYKNLIVWVKNNWSMGDLKGAFAGQHELIFFAHKGSVVLAGERSRDVWEFNRQPPKEHPTQKPVDLIEFAMSKVVPAGSVVLDLFGGSGSTLIACEKTSRHCRMMELDPAYCDVIVKRWENFTGNTAVCEPSPTHFTEPQETF